MTGFISPNRNELRAGIQMLGLSFACMALLRWGGEPLLPLCAVLAITLVAYIVRAPQLGFAALPPLLLATSYPPAFDDPGTLLFILVGVVWVGTEMWRAHVLPRYPAWLWKIALLAGIVLAINLATATHHGIALSAWLRGLYPFLLLGLAIPFLLRKLPTHCWQLLAAAVGLTCLVLSAEILYIYCANQLWETMPTTSDLAQRFLNSAQGKHFAALNGAYTHPIMTLRITLILPEAAGVFVPLGVVGWSLAAHMMPHRWRWIACAAAAICFCAAIATITRSMIFCCGLSISATLLLYYWNSRKRLTESAMIGAMVLAFSAPFFVTTAAFSDLLQRNRDLLENAKSYKASTSANASISTSALQDIGYRAQEYKQAWQAFANGPLTGQGFGHAIKLAFPKGFKGEIITVDATYTHSWILYWLMVAGIPGLLLYCLITFAPLVRLRAFRDVPHLSLTLVLAGAGMLLASYGLFFAVYRTLPNVICLSMLLGWTLSSYGIVRKRP